MAKGKLIVFEGLDCSFKETNSKKLAELLNSAGYKTKIEHFPRYENNSSYFVREWLAGNYGEKDKIERTYLGKQLVSSFYILDMFDYMNKIGLKALNSGTNIILDRYYYSNIYFRLAMDSYTRIFRKNKLIFDTELLADSANLPKADYVFKMRTNLDLMLNKIHEKASKNDIHENDDEYMKNVFDAFEEFDFKKLLAPNGQQFDIFVYNDNKFNSEDEIFKNIVSSLIINTRDFNILIGGNYV
jgi:dTMP kinase